MLVRTLRPICFVLVLWFGLGAAIAAESGQNGAAAWARYLAHADDEPARPRPPDEARFSSNRFFRAESECTANATALLAANDLLAAAPLRWDFSYSRAWDDKLVVRALYHDASGRAFLFACLIGSAADLERTRLLTPAPSRNGPLEIDGARYSYSLLESRG